MITIKSNIEQFIGGTIAGYKKQVEYASIVASTATAKVVSTILRDTMSKSFDRPTAYTLNSLYVKPATKSNPQAIVKLKDEAGKGNPATKYLWAEIEGGNRNVKKFEAWLIYNRVMPEGYSAVPGGGARLNQYGNMSSGLIVQILSVFGANPELYSNTTANSRKRNKNLPDLFVINKPGYRLAMGIYQRTNGGLKPLLLFVKKPVYKVRFNFYDVGIDAAQKIYPQQYKDALYNALTSAR